MIRDIYGRRFSEAFETGMMSIMAEKGLYRHAFSLLERRRLRIKGLDNLRLFRISDMDIAGKLLDSVKRPIERY